MRQIFFLFILLSACTSLNKKNELHKAQNIYLKNLEYIKKYVSRKNGTFENLDETVIFFENLTGIKSDIIHSYNPYYNPSKENLQNWKKWYELNKNKLYIRNNKIYVSHPIKVKRDPKEVFESYINELKSMEKERLLDLDQINTLLYKIYRITGIQISYNKEYGCDFPTQKEFDSINDWYEKHKNNLVWNMEKQRIELKE